MPGSSRGAHVSLLWAARNCRRLSLSQNLGRLHFLSDLSDEGAYVGAGMKDCVIWG